jgi:predicted aspartyl protease
MKFFGSFFQKRTLLLLPLLLAACGNPHCGLTSVATLPIALTRAQPLVEIGINGQTARMLLDTGAAHSVLTRPAAMRLGLRMKPGRISNLEGVGGATRDIPVIATSLNLGGLSLGDRVTDVVPTRIGTPDGANPDGLLGMDILSAYDLDLDFGDRRLTLYRGSACPTVPLPMPGPATVVETALSTQGHLVMRAALDGRSVLAALDTGTQHSGVTARAAALSPAQLAGDRKVTLFGVGPGSAGAYLHRFASITVGGQTLRDPLLLVFDRTPPDFDMLIGMDWLAGRRLWISTGTGRIFLRTGG